MKDTKQIEEMAEWLSTGWEWGDKQKIDKKLGIQLAKWLEDYLRLRKLCHIK